jgi:hypothetical protein
MGLICVLKSTSGSSQCQGWATTTTNTASTPEESKTLRLLRKKPFGIEKKLLRLSKQSVNLNMCTTGMVHIRPVATSTT